MAANKLERLKELSTVVADTGDIEAIKKYRPVDATTNPSLILQAARLPKYRPLLDKSIKWCKENCKADEKLLTNCVERLGVEFGFEISQIVPGRISTEIDARLSFDTAATIEKALEIVGMYEQAGLARNRILIKIASTWEGIRAAQVLEREGINCNLTLLFDITQAAACADAGVYLISPFVGRILDWYQARDGVDKYSINNDPGVESVTKIFDYYKTHGYKTIVMGASFRSKEQVEKLAGCDRLTISPVLLQELQEDDGELEVSLDAAKFSGGLAKLTLDEKMFRWSFNDSAMASDKLSEGIRKFAADQVNLEEQLGRIMG